MNPQQSWLRFGINHVLQIIVIEPLFEEANRCRKLLADVMRELDKAGIGSCIADLPGTGESLTGIEHVRLQDWRDAIRAQAPGLIAAFRGGALLGDAARLGVWRFAPETGARTVRDLRRAALVSDGQTRLTGHALSDGFLAELEGATPAEHRRLRTVRLESDPEPADARYPGSPLWRRAEPGEDFDLARALAADLAQWARTCAA